MKKTLILGLGLIVAVAALTASVTYAIFHYQTPSVVNVMTAGNVQIELIEQQRDGKGGLEPFEQGKALSPIVGNVQQGEFDEFGMTKTKNYQDKIISVKNNGKNDAYVRVLIAYPAILKAESIATNGATSNEDALHANLGNRVDLTGNYTKAWGDKWKENWHWDYTSVESVIIEVEGVKYLVDCITFKDVLGTDAQTSAAIAGVYLDNDVDYKNGAYVLNGEELTGFNGVVTIPVLAQAVQADGFENALEAFESAFPYGENNENITEWFENTGLVNAKPEANAVRPAGFDPAAKGVSSVDGLTVTDNSDENTNLRALYTRDGKVNGNFTVTNSYLDGTYAMNVIGDDTGDLTVINTALRGWVSYDGFKNATFTNTTFGKNSNAEIYNVVRPYSNITFTNCDFTGTEFWLDKVPAGEKVTFVNCTMNGEVIDGIEDIKLPQGNEASVVIANS
jgi:hypothetical protein